MIFYDSTNTDETDSDYCAYQQRVFVIGDTTGQLGDCFFDETCDDGRKYIFVATMDIPLWDVYTESTGQEVRNLLHTRFVSVHRAGMTGSDDIAVDIVSGIHGGAWILGNSNLSDTTTTTSVRCIDDTSSTVLCSSGHGVLLLRTDILGHTQDAIRMQGDYLEAHALGMDIHTGAVYVELVVSNEYLYSSPHLPAKLCSHFALHNTGTCLVRLYLLVCVQVPCRAPQNHRRCCRLFE